MDMICKGQFKDIEKGTIRLQIEFIERLLGCKPVQANILRGTASQIILEAEPLRWLKCADARSAR